MTRSSHAENRSIHRTLKPTSRPHLGVLVLLIGLLGAASWAPAALAQDSLEVEVLDPKGKKLEGAQVLATSAEGGAEIQGVTNKKGKYSARLAPGTWNLTISAPGFGTSKVAVTIEKGMTRSAKITMLDEATAKRQEAIDAFNAAVGMVQSGDESAALAQFTLAAQMFEAAGARGVELGEAYRLVSLLAAQGGDLDRAEVALGQYLELEPTGLPKVAPAAYEVYRARGDEAKLPAARQALRDIGAARDLASKVFNEGVAETRDGNKAGALALFREASILDPELTPSYRSVAALHFNDQEYEETLAALEGLLSRDPAHKEGLRMAFFSHFELGHTEQANDVGARWIASAPGASNEMVETARKTFEGNNPKDARRLLDVVLSADPNNALAHYTMGRVLAGSGDIPGAKKHLQRFLELSPNHPDAADARQMLEGL
jgi:tetratricopeptide (TPR) repeat protein